MYGWAWALRLASEIHTFNDPDAQRWATNFYPLERKLVGAIKDYLPKLSYPVRTGVHPDTGFALAQILDYAHATDWGNCGKTVFDTCIFEPDRLESNKNCDE